MSGNFKREDLRVIKTRNACSGALLSLLRQRNFNKITVYDICNEALVSRAAFYMHFNDKYALVSHWLTEEKVRLADATAGGGKPTEVAVSGFIAAHKDALTNLIREADRELLVILSGFFSMLPQMPEQPADADGYSAMYYFCSGGMMALFKWLADNRFPEGYEAVVSFAYGMTQVVLNAYGGERGTINAV
jgi:AcrR family transcriptional regulator